MGWSTVGGDLRVPHFVGLHALQAILLIGWLLSRTSVARLSTRQRILLVWVAALAYFGLILILLWQALRGQSVIAPDSSTLIAYAILIGITCLSGAIIMVRGRNPLVLKAIVDN